MTVKQQQLILAWFDCLDPEDVDGICGPQTRGATKTMQGKLGIEQTGDFDQNTETQALNAMMNGWQPEDAADQTGTFWDEIEYFDREEFRCKCGGKYCDGFPAEPKETMVRIVDQLRKNLGVPITVISGLRCKVWNEIQGGVSNSQHMYGEAVDIYAKGYSQAAVEAELDRIGGVRYHYPIAGSSNVHFDVPEGSR